MENLLKNHLKALSILLHGTNVIKYKTSNSKLLNFIISL